MTVGQLLAQDAVGAPWMNRPCRDTNRVAVRRDGNPVDSPARLWSGPHGRCLVPGRVGYPVRTAARRGF